MTKDLSVMKDYKIVISSDALREYPNLSRLPVYLGRNSLNDFIHNVESREEGLLVQFLNPTTIIVKLRTQVIKNRTDFLGLEIPDEELSDICDVIREHSGRDPRRELYYTKKGSAFENLSDEARIQPNNFFKPRAVRKRHPLDQISTEEVIARRELAEKRWDRLGQKASKESSDDAKVNKVKEFFFKTKK